MIDMTYDQILDAALRLSREEQMKLARALEQSPLAGKFAREGADQINADEVEDYLRSLGEGPLDDDEWQTLFDLMVIDKPVNPSLPLDRAAWYDDGE